MLPILLQEGQIKPYAVSVKKKKECDTNGDLAFYASLLKLSDTHLKL